MRPPNPHNPLFARALAVGLIATALVLASHLDAQAAEVGTYDPGAVFQKHPAQAEMTKAWESVQPKMQEAQQAGDQEALQQVQQQYAQTRERLIEKFHKDVADVLPEVAKATGVKVVAVQVVYTAEDVQTKDITPDLIQAFSKKGQGTRERPPLPEMPRRER